MRSLLVVLSAAVTGGLGVFFVFNMFSEIGVMGANVIIRIDVFVGLIAALTIAAGGLTIAFRALLQRSLRDELEELRLRLAVLEKGRAES